MSGISRRRLIGGAASAALAGTRSLVQGLPDANPAHAQGAFRPTTRLAETGLCISSYRWQPAVAVDFVARVVGEHLFPRTAPASVIENAPGAGGTIGIAPRTKRS